MERELYSRDLAPVPEALVKPLFNTLPDIIVRPSTTAEVSDLLKRASAEGVPVIPRAGATTVFFNTIPVNRGMVMDLNLLNGVVALDAPGMTVRVKAATTWNDLEVHLNRHHFACKSMPSSAPAATIGGWFCMMGYGIGSLKYGPLMSQVRAIEVVRPDGRIERLSKGMESQLDWYASSEGTLGIVTEIELEIRLLTPMKHVLLHAPDMPAALAAIKVFLGQKTVPYNMHFSEACFLRGMKTLGLSHLNIETGCLVAVDYEGSIEELSPVEKVINGLLETQKKLVRLPDPLAETEWEERYRSIRIKRGGSSMLGGEVWLPVEKLPAYMDVLKGLAKRYSINLMSYGHVVSSERATVMSVFFSDETRTLKYIADLSLVKKIQDAAYENGGCPYGVGLWNTPYIRRIYSRMALKTIRERKKSLDPNNTMNPGKVYNPPALLNPLLFHLSMEFLAAVRRLFRKGW